tara:strand:- start:1599 stop:2075 length:477 start_codon:yes stop_codon:yes gene_type:complete
MKKVTSAIAAAALATSLLGCSSTLTTQQTAQVAGALVGGALGYGLGKGHKNKTAAILGGMVLGGFAGDFIGQKLSQQGKQAHVNTVAQTLETTPTGVTNGWRNPDAYQREQGSVRVTKTYEQSGQYCREFQQNITVGGQSQNGYGKACRMPDGQWQMM